jgi:hypothetical protein
MKTIVILCNADVTVVRDQCPAIYYDIGSELGRLPLQMLPPSLPKEPSAVYNIYRPWFFEQGFFQMLVNYPRSLSELSVEGGCFR